MSKLHRSAPVLTLTCLRVAKRFGLRAVGLVSLPVLAAADTIDTHGQAPYEQCGYCHEYDGNSRMAQYPKLAGLPEAYIAKQLRDFRSGARDGKGMMREAASLLSEEDIQTVARYFSSQTRRSAEARQLSPARQRGKTLFESGAQDKGLAACADCHAPHNELPTLAGQHAKYLASQMMAFKRNARRNDPDGVMRDIAAQMDEGDIQAVSQFLAAGAEPRP